MPQIAAIAPLIAAVAAAASAGAGIYSATRRQPRMPEAPGIPKADLASQGAMRSDLFGSNTPGFQAGLQGAPTGPLPGSGSAISQPLVGAPDFLSVLQRMGIGGGGGGLGSGSGLGSTSEGREGGLNAGGQGEGGWA